MYLLVFFVGAVLFGGPGHVRVREVQVDEDHVHAEADKVCR